MDDWVIREARREDAEEFVRAHEAAWNATGVTHARLGELVPFEQRVRAFEKGLEKVSDDARVWVAVRGARIVGLAACTREQETAELRNLYVVPEAWGSGVGAALLQTAVAWMKQLAAEAFLWVAVENARARRFYEREGWKADGEIRASSLGPRELRYRITF
jgi:GNAT superfamily N-acetyltransferase